MQNNNDYGSYPNMEFPYKYTKAGQKAMLDKYMSQDENVTISATKNEPPSAQISNNIDMSKLIPMLINKNLSTNDLLDMLLPMLGKSNLPIKDLLDISKKSTSTPSTPLPEKPPISTQGYKIVE